MCFTDVYCVPNALRLSFCRVDFIFSRQRTQIPSPFFRSQVRTRREQPRRRIRIAVSSVCVAVSAFFVCSLFATGKGARHRAEMQHRVNIFLKNLVTEVRSNVLDRRSFDQIRILSTKNRGFPLFRPSQGYLLDFDELFFRQKPQGHLRPGRFPEQFKKQSVNSANACEHMNATTSGLER
ncbi:hypothetical protein TGMAS_266980 [Toxoplasma gondii MAS]|uniref:Transmembrane protein n=1 Tax=Toxoplasma gondii MAS TaxID=943118 RepID=A0A086QMH0_TOXGO|nr:hypothetical protein TGMAS_266980 [Toxoplasma gondii MAS]